MGKDLFNPHLRKFSIRKLSIGVCSVLLSTLLLLGVTSQVNADETSAVSIQNTSSQTNSKIQLQFNLVLLSGKPVTLVTINSNKSSPNQHIC